MGNLKRFRPKNAAKEQIIANLLMLQKLNENLLPFVQKFDLVARNTETGDVIDTPDIVKLLKNNNMNKKFKNEVEEVPQRPFVKFEEEGDFFEGILTGETVDIKNGDNANKCFICSDKDGEKILPSNVILNRKLENAVKIKFGSDVPESLGLDIYIEYTGYVKKDGVQNKMKDFKVFTT